MIFLNLIHLVAVLFWVGGMFFAYVVLRPAAVEILQPPERLRLWIGVFRRFFNWLWGAIGVIFVTGMYMIYQYGGMAHVEHHVHVMSLLGVVMVCIFCYVYFACFVPLRLYVNKEKWKEAGSVLSRIRYLIAVNLTIGLITITVAKIGFIWK
jgi:uncharacterized membrane protein